MANLVHSAITIRYWQPGARWRATMGAIKQAQCLDYQSCEHEGWERSEGKKYCDAVISTAISHLPGYEQEPWGI